ncbi:MAG: hypothetical protein Q7R52_00955 [archaeon]|nr:hypothetical protein [archaeon]
MAKKRKRQLKNVDSNKRRIKLSFINLILFLFFTAISYLLYTLAATDFMEKTFFLLTLVLSFVSVAFLIILLVFIILRIMNKK